MTSRVSGACLFISLTAAALCAQSAGNPAEGPGLFRAKCVACHGVQGNGGGGGVDLLQGKFKRPSSDSDILGYIRNGIPGTAMDKVDMPESEARKIVEYIRLRAQSHYANEVTGDAFRGKTVFEGKGGCRRCHSIKGSGSHFGPDLSDIGGSRSPAEIERSIVDPDAEILPQNRIVEVVPRNGKPIVGRQLNQDSFTVQIVDTNDRLLTFERPSLTEVKILMKSPMPSQKGTLSSVEIADVVTYLAALKDRQREASR
ncbi:MAG: c-type cytochrome [Acidobacteriia bacterium]|nr:c-type cytochrome [Terriglobia bacterium]